MVEKNKKYFEVDHNKYRFDKDTISLIKDFEKLAKKYHKHLKFCILVDKKNDVSRGLGHELGVYNHVSLPTLRIMKFGEYHHVIRKRKKLGYSAHPDDIKAYHANKHKIKHVHKTRKQRVTMDNMENHPAHNSSKREVKKYKSEDLSFKGMERFIKDFLVGKTRHYHKADHIPHDNHKRIVKHLNSHNFEAFLEEAKQEKKMAIIWVCVKGAYNYPDNYKQIKHLAKHGRLKKYYKFGKIDPFKNDRPKALQGNAHADKLFIYRGEMDVAKSWKQVKYEDMAAMFQYLMVLIDEAMMSQEDL